MSDKKGILVVGLTQRGELLPATFELLTAARALAQASGSKVSAAVLGAKASSQAQELVDRGADKVFVFEHPSLENFICETQSKAVADLVAKEGMGLVLLPTSVTGRSMAARLSVLLKAGPAVEALEVRQNGTGLKAKRSHYGGNIISELAFGSQAQVLTLQPMAFSKAEKQSGRQGEVVKVAFEPGPAKVEFVSFTPEEAGEIDLGSAERIVSGGRGLGSAEGFKLIRDFAHAIGAAVGASRAVVDSGWIPYRHQVGLTGKAVRPKLYVACGISGQVQHLAGMSSSGQIVAINTDPDCPMMEMANVSVVGDINELLPLVIEEIKKRRGG